VPAALWIPATAAEKALLIASVLLVMIVELLNTGVEVAIDRISFEHNSLSKRAKDIGSAAVFVALVLMAVVWGLVAGPRVMPAW
jgi:diacylglycerol kinase (ATP)